MAKYTVFEEGKTIKGDAREVLEEIRLHNSVDNDEIAKMDVEQYAQALIEDAPYFLPIDLLEQAARQPFASPFDRALTYLSLMPTSGVRILSAA